MIVLLDEVNLLDVRVSFRIDDFFEVDSSIYEFFFRDQLFEDSFSVFQILSIEVLTFGLFNASDGLSIQNGELGESEQDLESIVFSMLDRVEAQVQQRQELQGLDTIYFSYVFYFVEGQVEGTELIQVFKSFQSFIDIIYKRGYFEIRFWERSSLRREGRFSRPERWIILLADRLRVDRLRWSRPVICVIQLCCRLRVDRL